MLDLVGIRYNEEGLTPDEGFSCYSFIRWVLNAEFDFNLPEQPPCAAAWPRYVKVFKPPLPRIQRFDVLMFSEILPDLANHVGIAVSATDFLHASSQHGGVVCERIERYSRKLVGIGRPHDYYRT